MKFTIAKYLVASTAIIALGVPGSAQTQNSSPSNTLSSQADCWPPKIPELKIFQERFGPSASYMSIANQRTRQDVMNMNASVFNVYIFHSPSRPSNWRGLVAQVDITIKNPKILSNSVSSVRVLLDGRPTEFQWIFDVNPFQNTALARPSEQGRAALPKMLETTSDVEIQVFDKRGRQIASQTFAVGSFRDVPQALQEYPTSCTR